MHFQCLRTKTYTVTKTEAQSLAEKDYTAFQSGPWSPKDNRSYRGTGLASAQAFAKDIGENMNVEA